MGATPQVLATLIFDAVAQGTSALTLSNVNTFQALGIESGSCSPVVVKSGTCTNARVTVPADIDGDGVKNNDETSCGGDKSNAALRPERIDGIFAGVDDDGDTLIDEPLPIGSENYDCDGDGAIGTAEVSIFTNPQHQDTDLDTFLDGADNCPVWPNAAQALPAWPVPAVDPDCDGFATAREQWVGTDPARHCPDTVAVNDEAVDAWPSDFNDSQFTSLADVVLMGPVYNQPTAADPAKKRFDLNASGVVSLADVVLMGPFYNKSCG